MTTRHRAASGAANGFVRRGADRFLVVPLGALIAILWANAHATSYFQVAETLAFAVNGVGMAFVLAFLAQEVVEAMLPGGALYSWRRRGLPIVAALGGVLGSGGVYAMYIFAGDTRNLLGGWPIATAVDLAFCYFTAVTIFGRGAAVSFVLLLAIASDAIGLTLASHQYWVLDTHPAAAALLVPALWSAAVFRRRGLHTVWPYVLISGGLSWFALFLSGVHPALALVPIVPFMPHTPRRLEPTSSLELERHRSPEHFEHVFRYPVQAIAFLFGLVNGGVLIRGFGNGTWAVLAAGLGGRPLGVILGVVLGVTAGLKLPSAVRWRDVIVIALAASPGFTFALFFATAVFPVGPLLIETKMGALATAAGMLVAFGAAWLLRVGRFARH